METQTEILRRFSTEETISLDLKLPSGRIEVEALADATETTVELSPLDDRSSTVKAIEDAIVEVRMKKGKPKLVVELRGKRFGSTGSVLMHVRCPEGRDLEASAASAEVEGTGRFGAVSVNTASGELRLQDVDGDLDVNSASGDIEIDSVAGRASLDTASGDVAIRKIGGGGRFRSASGDTRIGEASGSIKVDSASGDLSVQAMRAGEITVRSASGDIDLGVVRGSTVGVDARSMSGRMTSEIELDGGPPETGGDAPHVELHVVSMSGDVRIRRA